MFEKILNAINPNWKQIPPEVLPTYIDGLEYMIVDKDMKISEIKAFLEKKHLEGLEKLKNIDLGAFGKA